MLVYLLASRELEFGSTQSLHHVFLVLGLGTNRHDHLTNAHAGHGALRFPESTTHSSLKPEVKNRHWTLILQTFDFTGKQDILKRPRY